MSDLCTYDVLLLVRVYIYVCDVGCFVNMKHEVCAIIIWILFLFWADGMI